MGERQHRPGLDLTFSASKSASIAALVIGDDRITKAHDEAVKAAMTVVEERFAKTRYQVDGKIVTGEAKGLIAGIYRHDTSRALDPNLHSHAVIANMVKNDNGTYTALTNEAMFKNRTLITEIYRSEFEARLSALGIATDRGAVWRGQCARHLPRGRRGLLQATSGNRLGARPKRDGAEPRERRQGHAGNPRGQA